MQTLRIPITGLFLVIALALLVAATPASAAATAVTTCGTTLNTPGQYYLANNLTCSASDGVMITASGVHFSMDGYTISGAQCLYIGIFVLGVFPGGFLTDVHVDGGTVTGFGGGIVLSNVTSSTVNGVTVTGNCQGIGMDQVYNTVFSSIVVTNNSQLGYSQTSSTGNIIRGNTITGNGAGLPSGCGICLDASFPDNILILSNTISSNFGDGIQFLFAGTGLGGSTIQGNTVNGNTGVGINMAGQDNVIKSNTATGNGTDDLFDATTVPACDSNIWKSNTFITSNQSCIK